VSDLWGSRAAAYRTSTTHMQGDDLEAVVTMCEPEEGTKALDVATGGGHVARRLREEGCQVVTVDSSPGMRPDVISRAEELPFADGSFDVVVCRIAAHHFADLAGALAAMARVTSSLVVIEDTLYLSEQQEEAERLRDPSHVRSRSEDEWKELFTGAGLEVEQVEFFEKVHRLDDWLARTGCEGEEAARVTELLGPQLEADGRAWRDTKILLKGRKSQS
jgi:SAM-dependent methyltransferase